jgi:hypothetical protein
MGKHETQNLVSFFFVISLYEAATRSLEMSMLLSIHFSAEPYLGFWWRVAENLMV